MNMNMIAQHRKLNLKSFVLRNFCFIIYSINHQGQVTLSFFSISIDFLNTDMEKSLARHWHVAWKFIHCLSSDSSDVIWLIKVIIDQFISWSVLFFLPNESWSASQILSRKLCIIQTLLHQLMYVSSGSFYLIMYPKKQWFTVQGHKRKICFRS